VYTIKLFKAMYSILH